MRNSGAIAAALTFFLLTAQIQARAQASSGEESPDVSTIDPGPHPELDPDTDYAFWCNVTIRSLVDMGVLQEKHFKRNPQEVLQSLDLRVGNSFYSLKREAVQQMLQEYNSYYLADTIAFSSSQNPKDLRKDLRGCRAYF